MPKAGVLGALREHRRLYERIHRNEYRNTPEGHWINEAFVLRLWAVLEAHQCVGLGEHLTKQEGVKVQLVHVEILEGLRHALSHGSGNVGSQNSRKLHEKLVAAYDLNELSSVIPGKFMLPKDKVLRKMSDGCLAYCEALLAAVARSEQDTEGDKSRSRSECA